jgi:hypothetical protein
MNAVGMAHTGSRMDAVGMAHTGSRMDAVGMAHTGSRMDAVGMAHTGPIPREDAGLQSKNGTCRCVPHSRHQAIEQRIRW